MCSLSTEGWGGRRRVTGETDAERQGGVLEVQHTFVDAAAARRAAAQQTRLMGLIVGEDIKREGLRAMPYHAQKRGITKFWRIVIHSL